ncbi:MAG: response regulator [Bacteroidota bacterium]
MWATSTVGKGSTFYLQLPYVETDAVPLLATLETRTTTEISLPKTNQNKKTIVKPTVLIVEDNADLRQYMKLSLSDKYDILTAENGQVALDLLTTKQPSPDLILLDLMMPVMDGKVLLQKIKSTDKLRTLPIIVLTAQQTVEVKIETLRIGIDDYLTKPFVEKELLARVDNLIVNAQVRKQPIAETPTEQKEEQLNNLTAADLEWLKMVEEKMLAQIGNSQFKLSDLAHDLHISMRSFQQKIKLLTGQTPKKYQRQILLHEARNILKSGRVQTVSELSYRLGFEDQHYFSGLYKKQFGVTPREELGRLG